MFRIPLSYPSFVFNRIAKHRTVFPIYHVQLARYGCGGDNGVFFFLRMGYDRVRHEDPKEKLRPHRPKWVNKAILKPRGVYRAGESPVSTPARRGPGPAELRGRVGSLRSAMAFHYRPTISATYLHPRSANPAPRTDGRMPACLLNFTNTNRPWLVIIPVILVFYML